MGLRQRGWRVKSHGSGRRPRHDQCEPCRNRAHVGAASPGGKRRHRSPVLRAARVVSCTGVDRIRLAWLRDQIQFSESLLELGEEEVGPLAHAGGPGR